jgi:hypothetical protein
MSNRLRALLPAFAAIFLVWTWQALTVRYSYGGNWTGLFCTGAVFPYPPALAKENIYTFPNSVGYDGQAYHYLAHDPWFQRGFSNYLDAPRVRSRRILLSALAWAVALGRDDWTDRALFGVSLLFIGLGAYWTARLAESSGKSMWLGLAFVLIPSVLVSIDRILTDGALAALCVAFVWYVRREAWLRMSLVCLFAALTRETGFGLAAGASLFFLWRRDLRHAAVIGASALPALAWYWICFNHTPDPHFDVMGFIPFEGLARRLVIFSHYALPPLIEGACIALDHLGVIGIVLALFLVWKKVRARDTSAAAFVVYDYAGLAIFLRSPEAWWDVYAFGRALSPLLVILALEALELPARADRVRAILPAALQDPRIGLQWGRQILHVVHGLLGR